VKAVVYLRPEARELAEKIASGLSADLFPHQGDLAGLFSRLFTTYQNIVCIMAMGIVVRHIAPLISTKDKDPGIVVVDEKGNYVISLLSGHLGGANDLARQTAILCGGQAVVTTATDVYGYPAIDVVARKYQLVPEPLPAVKGINSLLLRGQWPRVYTDLPEAREWFDGWQSPIICLDQSSTVKKGTVEGETPWQGPALLSKGESRCGGTTPSTAVYVTDRIVPGFTGLYLRPKRLVLGLGAKRGIPVQALMDFIHTIMAANGLSIKGIRALATYALKQHEPAFEKLANTWDVPMYCYPQDELNQTVSDWGLQKSGFVREKTGVNGVCEPAAVRAAMNLAQGKGVKLLMPKTTAEGMSMAVATWL